MGIFDIFSGPQRLTLDATSMEKWPDRLIRKQGLHRAFDTYLQNVSRQRGFVEDAKSDLTDPALQEKIPDRAYELYKQHLPAIVRNVDELLNETDFVDNPFLVDEQQERFREALQSYEEQTRKSRSALSEFLGGELSVLQEHLRALEDAILSINPIFDEARFGNIHELKQLIDEYQRTRPRERRVTEIRNELLGEIDRLEAKKRRIKEKITYYVERSKSSKFQELIAEEARIIAEMDEVKEQNLTPADEEHDLKPLQQRIATIRKQMINDVTALNISEQRSFLEATKDHLRSTKRKLTRAEEILAELNFETFRRKFATLLEPFGARIEDTSTIIEDEDEDVVPQ